ncbi:hypothetical protein K431DRAFT_133717 [Polychaeton citri CBS 116435]|uniref:Uncharacterized protein n=1 Tax=Polychaeton citri CBS 116435 TaxID=1314669 RepID=A0A9P4UTK8_9PEZI|nr:hypothetical protein K431DRAFT_133717 [Polychaeton citri CBS 116435]
MHLARQTETQPGHPHSFLHSEVLHHRPNTGKGLGKSLGSSGRQTCNLCNGENAYAASSVKLSRLETLRIEGSRTTDPSDLGYISTHSKASNLVYTDPSDLSFPPSLLDLFATAAFCCPPAVPLSLLVCCSVVGIPMIVVDRARAASTMVEHTAGVRVIFRQRVLAGRRNQPGGYSIQAH